MFLWIPPTFHRESKQQTRMHTTISMNTASLSSSPTNKREDCVSKVFCSPDAEVTFTSSDGIMLRIYKGHLNSYTSAGFSTPSGTAAPASVESEPVHLSESANILEILFQFIQPPSEAQNYRHPSVRNMDPVVFFAVAEAAEKYVVYGAMNVCITRMDSEQMLSGYPFEILNHCAKHGYADLADQAAEKSMAKPLDQATSKLTAPGLLAKYIKYYIEIQGIGNSTADNLSTTALTHNCPIFSTIAILYRQTLDKNPLSFDDIPQIPMSSRIICTSVTPGLICPCKGTKLAVIAKRTKILRGAVRNFGSPMDIGANIEYAS